MITLKTELLKVPEPTSEELMGERWNMSIANNKVNSWVELIEAQIRVQNCPNHHLPQGTIILKAMENSQVQVIKKDFCCTELEEAFSFL